MAEDYPKWEGVAKDLETAFAWGSPRFKFESVKEAEEKVFTSEPIDTPDGGKSVQLFPHVYFYANITYTRVDGAKCVSHVSYPYHKSKSEWVPVFKYGKYGGGDVVSPPTKKDPMEFNITMANKLFKKYMDLMLSKHFPSQKWASHVKSNGVKLIIKDIKFDEQHGDKAYDKSTFEHIDYGSLDTNLKVGYLLCGEYHDNNGSFEFVYPVYSVNFRAVLGKSESWTIGSFGDPEPLENLTPKAVDRIQELFESKDEPRKFLGQFIPELSPRDKAIKLMMDKDPTQRSEGLSTLQFEYRNFINEEDLIRTIIELKNDPNELVQREANRLLEYAKGKTENAAIRKMIENAAASTADAEFTGYLNNLNSSDAAKKNDANGYFYRGADEYKDNARVVSVLSEVCVAGDELACNTLRKMGKYGAVELKKLAKDLDNPDKYARDQTLVNLASNENVAGDTELLNKLIAMKAASKDMMEKMRITQVFESVTSYYADKLTPEMKKKVEDAIKAR